MTNAVLDAAPGGRGQIAVLVKFLFPGSNTVRVAIDPYTSSGDGHYKGRILSISDMTITPSDSGGDPPAPEITVHVDDTDRTIARIYSGLYANSVRGSVANVYIAGPSVLTASWFTIPMKVTKIKFPQPFVAAVVLRIDDDQFLTKAMGGWVINRTSWPNAPASSIGKMAPIIYGSFDAVNIQNGPGMAGPCILVDESTFKYVVAAGRVKTQTRVYKDGVKVTSPPAFAYATVNGRDYTTMTFSSTQGTSVITCDLEGLTTTSDGLGTVITNGMTQLAHKLTNFILGDWKTGAWLSTSAILDATRLASCETFFTNTVANSTDYTAAPQSGYEAISKLSGSYQLTSWWTWGAKLAFAYRHANLFAAPYTGSRFRWYADAVAPLALDEEDTKLTTRVLVSLTPSATQGYLTSLEVIDASATSQIQGSINIANGEAK